jgi:hypothetical protein
MSDEQIKTHVVVIQLNGKMVRCVGPLAKPDAYKVKRKLVKDTKAEWWVKSRNYEFSVVNCWPTLDGPATDYSQRFPLSVSGR